MQTITETMTQILKQNTRCVNVKAQIGDIDLTNQDICDFDISQELCNDAFSIGNAPSASISIKFINTDNLPTDWKTNPLKLWCGVCNQVGVTNPAEVVSYTWFPMGVYYLDDKSIEKTTLTTQINGNDILKKLENIQYTTELEYPSTIGAVLSEMESNYNITFTDNTTSIETVSYPFTGNVRAVLETIAQDLGGNYIADYNGDLKLIRVLSSLPPFSITADNYLSLKLKSDEEQILSKFRLELAYEAFEAGDDSGKTQISNNNYFTTQEQINSLYALAELPITYQAYECKLQGMPHIEVGDRIQLTTAQNEVYSLLVLQRKFKFDGGFTDSYSAGAYEENGVKTSTGVNTITSRLYKAEINIDKNANEIEAVTQEVSGNNADIAQLRLDTNTITANVTNLRQNIDNSIGGIQGQLASISNSLDAKLDANQVSILISETINSGEVDSITTSTGFTFDENGLTVSKSGTEMETLIDENGMEISRSGETVLEVNDTGVVAENITLSKYLTIGLNSRLEDYVDIDGNDATAIYWIGGNV